MLLNLFAKCKVMHTGNNNNEFSYEMNGKVLDKVLIEKDLGIMISSGSPLLTQTLRTSLQSQPAVC